MYSYSHTVYSRGRKTTTCHAPTFWQHVSHYFELLYIMGYPHHSTDYNGSMHTYNVLRMLLRYLKVYLKSYKIQRNKAILASSKLKCWVANLSVTHPAKLAAKSGVTDAAILWQFTLYIVGIVWVRNSLQLRVSFNEHHEVKVVKKFLSFYQRVSLITLSQTMNNMK